MNPPPRHIPVPALLLLFVVSGASGLVYEVIWMRQLILVFGSTLFATSAVLATFMGGLALGAYLAGRYLGGREISPLRLYGLLEIGIGAYALGVPLIFRGLTPLYRAAWDAGGSDSFVLMSLAKFVGIALVLLVPTALMGASLPVLARQVADDPARIGGKVGALYATNTAGAVLGTLIAGFVAVPALGVQRTLWLTALVNAAVGVVALLLSRRFPSDPVHSRSERELPSPSSPVPRAAPGAVGVALIAFGVSGFGAMVLEVAWTRGLSLVIGSSVYAFALMLLAFLIGLAAGGAAFSVLLRRRPTVDAGTLLAVLLASAGALAYLTAHLMPALPRLFAEAYLRLSPGANGMLAIELALGLLVMFPTTFALGGIFPAVLQIHARGLETVPGSVGTVYAANTLGTIFGAFAGGFLMIPAMGVRNTLVIVSAVEIALGIWVARAVARPAGRTGARLVVPMTIALALVVLVRPGWDALLMNSGVYYYIHDVPKERGWAEFAAKASADREVLYLAEGLTSTVVVVDQPKHGNRYLAVNGKIDASSTSDLETQLMCSHLPLLLHPAPKDVMVIGLASGISVGAAATHPVRNIRVVEVEKAVLPAARLFGAWNGGVLDDPRVVVSINDARNELEFSSRQYDVIISEPSNPFMTVAANLFTEDFFRLARTRVRADGLFLQWVQAYCLAPQDLRSVIASFHAAFPKVMIFQVGAVDLLLVGSQDPQRFDLEAIGARMREPDVRLDLARVGIREPMDLLPLFELGDEEVDRLVEGAPRNTDDNARVEYSAPKTFALDTTTMNLDMIEEASGEPLDYLRPEPTSAADRARFHLALAAAWLRRQEPFTAGEYAKFALGSPLDGEARAFFEGLPPDRAP